MLNVPDTTKRLAIAQAITNNQPLMIFYYGKTFVIAHRAHTLPKNAVLLAEIESNGEYRDCQEQETEN